MKFYRVEVVDIRILKKINQAPMTNCGSEHEFAHGDNDFKQSDGSTSLTTILNKHMIKGTGKPFQTYFDSKDKQV